jgi:hypothetical protein
MCLKCNSIHAFEVHQSTRQISHFFSQINHPNSGMIISHFPPGWRAERIERTTSSKYPDSFLTRVQQLLRWKVKSDVLGLDWFLKQRVEGQLMWLSLHLVSTHTGTTACISGLLALNLRAGGSAEWSGKVRVGDRLITVDGNNVSGRTPSELSQIITGPEGSKVYESTHHNNAC